MFTIPLNPPLIRGTWFCSRYRHIHTTLTKNWSRALDGYGLPAWEGFSFIP